MKQTVLTLCILSLAAAVHAGHPYGKKRKPGNKKPKAAYVVNPQPGTPRPVTTPRPLPTPQVKVKTPIGVCP